MINLILKKIVILLINFYDLYYLLPLKDIIFDIYQNKFKHKAYQKLKDNH